MKEFEVGATRAAFQDGAHICFIYNDEEERKRVIGGFLREGLGKGAKLGYFVNELSVDDMRHHLAELGVVVPPGSPAAQLTIRNAVQTYCPDGCFEPEQMVTTLRNFYRDSVEEGYAGAHLTGEMGWALRGIPGSEKLIEYEDRLNRLVQDAPATLICQYDANQFDGGKIYEILRVHPLVIVRGQVVRNPFYAPSTV